MLTGLHRGLSVVSKGLYHWLTPLIAYNDFWILERDLAIPIEWERPRIQIEFRQATEQDLARFLDYEGSPLNRQDRQVAQSRLIGGDLCFIGIHADQLVSYAWVSSSEAEFFKGTKLRLGQGWAFHYKAYTVRKYRGNGLHRACNAYWLNSLKNQGIARVVLHVHKRNRTSLRNYMLARSKIIGSVRRLTLLGIWSFTWLPAKVPSYLKVPIRDPSLAVTRG